MNKRIILGLVLIVLIILAGGLILRNQKTGNKNNTQQTNSEFPAALDVKVTKSDKGLIPGFPTHLSIENGAVLVSSQKVESAKLPTQYMATYTVPLPVSSVYTFYDKYLKSAGYKIISSVNKDGYAQITAQKAGTFELSVTSEKDNTSYATLVWTEAK